MIKDENVSISKKQVIEDVNALEVEQKPVPESLERDLKRATQGMSDDKLIDDAIESVTDRVNRTGTSSLPEEKVKQFDAFAHRGFFIQVFGLGNSYYGWAREVSPIILDRRIEFEAKGHNTPFGAGQFLVNLVNTYRNRRYN